MKTSASFAPLLERFFLQRLMQQRQASPHTISSYRDSFRQFLKFAQQRLRKLPSNLSLAEIDAPLVGAFLEDLETTKGVSVRSRNLRLTAIHSFFRYAALEAPDHLGQIQRVLAIPSKRFTRKLVSFLVHAEVDALLAAPDQRTWSGRRDHAFLLLAVQTGLRLSEMTGLKHEDIVLGTGAHVHVIWEGPQGALLADYILHARRTGIVVAGAATRKGRSAVSQCERRAPYRPRRAVLD